MAERLERDARNIPGVKEAYSEAKAFFLQRYMSIDNDEQEALAVLAARVAGIIVSHFHQGTDSALAKREDLSDTKLTLGHVFNSAMETQDAGPANVVALVIGVKQSISAIVSKAPLHVGSD